MLLKVQEACLAPQGDVAPAALPARHFTFDDLNRGIIVPIQGRQYMVRVCLEDFTPLDNGCHYDECPEPSDYTVEFVPLQFPASDTHFKVWDEAKVRQQMLEREKLGLVELTELSTREGLDLTEEIEDTKRHIQGLEDGTLQLGSNSEVQFFGEPRFLQNPVNPQGSQLLCVLETCWGDCGNEHFFFSVDEHGEPNAVWHEASCC